MSALYTELTLSWVATHVYLPDRRGGFDVRNCPEALALARRIVACVNACAGVPIETLEACGTVAGRIAWMERNAVLRATLAGLLARFKAVCPDADGNIDDADKQRIEQVRALLYPASQGACDDL